MTCHVEAYWQLYHAHAGQPGTYHLSRVRRARELIELHRKTCPECRGDGTRTNYNLAPGRAQGMAKPKEA